MPDVLKTTATNQEKITVKPIDKLPEKSKENVPKPDDAKAQNNKKEVKLLGAQTANKSLVFGLDASAANNSSPSSKFRTVYFLRDCGPHVLLYF